MAYIIFLNTESRVEGYAKSTSYKEDVNTPNPKQVFVGENFQASDLMKIYDPSTNSYIADEVTEAFYNPPPPPPETEQEETV